MGGHGAKASACCGGAGAWRLARKVSVIWAKRESRSLLILAVILIVADLSGVLLVDDVFWVGAGGVDWG